MPTRTLAHALCGVALTLFLAPALRADQPAPGFSSGTLAYSPPLFSVTAELSGGDVIVFDGAFLDRVTDTGVLVDNYATFSPPVFASFVELAPDESYALVGESSNNEIYHVDLGTGAATLVATVELNYDAAIDAAGTAWISGFDSTQGMNALVELEVATGTTVTRGLFTGFSGPLALEASGDLLFALTSTPNRIVRFDAADLAGSATLTEMDGTLVTTGWSGLAYIATDAESDEVLVVENDFVTFTDPTTVWRVGADPASSRMLYEAGAGESLGKPRLATSSSDLAVFREFQPASGGELVLPATDFTTFAARRVLEPARPVSGVSGPGVGIGQVGVIDFEVSGAEPGGLVVVYYGLAADFFPTENVFQYTGTPPLHWSLDVNEQGVIPFPFLVEPDGTFTFSFYNSGFASGFLAMQAALSDVNLNLVGTATGLVL